MKNYKVILNNNKCIIRKISLPSSDSLSKPENTGSTNNRQLSVFLRFSDPAHHAQSTTILKPISEHKIKVEKQGQLTHRWRPIDSLGPAHLFRIGIRPNSQRAVEHSQHAKECG